MYRTNLTCSSQRPLLFVKSGLNLILGGQNHTVLVQSKNTENIWTQKINTNIVNAIKLSYLVFHITIILIGLM